MYGLGGTIRTTLNTASALAARGHDVEIVSVMRTRCDPLFDFDPRVPVRSLLDLRPVGSRAATDAGGLTGVQDRQLLAAPAAAFPGGETIFSQYSALADARVAEYLGAGTADVYVGTRPGLNCYLARFAPRSAVRVGQEHMFHDYHSPGLRRRLEKSYQQLDAVVTVSAADAEIYRESMPHLAGKLHHIPNAIASPELPPSTGDSRVVVAAGRIEPVKRYDVLIRAFAEVARRHPDWQLRVYGSGTETEPLLELIGELGVNDSVLLMGPRADVDVEWVKGSVTAVTSEYESFGLTIVEAMAAGLPVVSTACHMGPVELIDHGVDGLLVEPGDPSAVAAGLSKLIENPRLREVMAAQARAKADKYTLDSVVQRHEALFSQLLRDRPVRRLRKRARDLVRRNAAAAVAARYPADGARREPAAAVGCRSLSFEDVRLQLPGGAKPADWTLRPDRGRAPLTLAQLGAVRDDAESMRLDAAAMAKLSEGVWRLESTSGSSRAGHIDTRALLSGVPESLPQSVVTPFSAKGALALRVWRRKRYAEVSTVYWSGADIVVCGRLWGVDWSNEPVETLLQHKSEPDAQVCFSATAADGEFRLQAPAASLLDVRTAAREVWSPWLRLRDRPSRRVRPGLFFDDVADKKFSRRYPGAVVSAAAGTAEVTPYFMSNNQLAIRVLWM